MLADSAQSGSQSALLLDTSVVVNINATGYADKILSALPFEVLVPAPVLGELKRGLDRGYTDATDIAPLLEAGILKEQLLSSSAVAEFIALASGASSTTLGDGESATIAQAYVSGDQAAIDERKARRICKERYPKVQLVSTVEILSSASVQSSLTQTEISDAVLAALEVANMQVHPEHYEWVLDKIDAQDLRKCLSLPRSLREAHASNANPIAAQSA